MQTPFFENYLKVAFRVLVRQKIYSLINIFGLVLGFTCCLLIFQYVAYERSYDEHITQASRVYRLRLDLYQQGKLSWQSATVFPGVGPSMKEEIPEIESFCRLFKAPVTLLNHESNVKHRDNKSYYADPSFLSVFGVKLLKGHDASALDAPDKIILSESSAKIYFGKENPVGRILKFRTPQFERNLQVMGVFRDFPENSHLRINQLISYATLASIYRANGDQTNSVERSWGWYDFYTYFKLKPDLNVERVAPKLARLCDKYYNNGERQRNNNLRVELHTIPVQDIHLYSKANQEAEVNGDGKAISFLFLISLLIISIAWINYINLTTAKSVERAKEVGIRKVVGAERLDFLKQFMTESFLINACALCIAVIIQLVLRPWFVQITGTGPVSYATMSTYWLIFAGVFLAGTVMSGIYPALVLSNFQPAKVLKGVFKNNKSNNVFRKSLIVWQFSTAIILITTTLIIYQQVRHMRNQSLGADIEQTIILDGSTVIQDTLYPSLYPSFKSDLLTIAGVKSVTASTDVMGREIYYANLNNRIGSNNQVTLYNIGVDYDFVPSYNLKILSGRNFSKEFADQKSVVINEKALKLLEFENPEKAINQKFVSQDDTLTIIGVINNYHHEALQKQIPPVILRLQLDVRNYYSIKIENTNVEALMAKMKPVWNRYFPNDPFNYYFLDDLFNQHYKSNEQFGSVFNVFSLLSVLISCIGLLGLSAFTIVQRAKEIGIRKVLGASVINLLFLVSKDFLMLVLISFALGIPIAWWVIHEWLQNFAYRIDVKFWAFAFGGALMTAVALLTVWSQALKVIRTNPVKNLKLE